MSPLVSSAQPAVASPALPLPPCGIEDAADAEMDGVSGGVADVLGASGTPRSPSSASSSAPTSADPAASPALGPQTAESAALDQRRQKAKAKKQRQKAKKKAEARQRTDEAKSEMVDDDVNRPQLSAVATLVDTWTTRHGSTWESYGQLGDELELLVYGGLGPGWNDEEDGYSY